MNFYYNLVSFDITKQIKQYRGKKIEELFKNQRIIKDEMEEFFKLKN